ncbi:MAG: phosphoribosyl-AMP cyclohydrolase [Gammaproteobacteria bacterium]|jgi:phosphoribosyl-AMP cyclohydrolase
MTDDYLDQVNWDAQGLVPVITQDHVSKRILTQAWLNREALQTAVQEKRAVYWSRSRQSLWRKGEQSGNIQELVDIYLDCDNDSVCYLVRQVGGVACHTGRESCFYQKLVNCQWQSVDPVIKDPSQMYGGS